MSDEPDSLVLVYLRRMEAKLDRLGEDVRELKQPLTGLEAGQARLRQDVADIYGAYAGLQGRFDRMDSRLERIERRLDLQESAS
jgi:predicted nuclease with TOPRIM domain